MPLGETNYGEMWDGADERPIYHPEKCANCSKCIVKERCPTMAFTEVLNIKKCFGCGMCAYSCDFGTFEMKTGSVKLKLAQGHVEVPIACRQSDIKRAREIILELKKRIEQGNFQVSDGF